MLISAKFTDPDFLGGVPWLTFGRLRPVHVNGVIWGAFSTLFIGLAYYIVPRLAGVPVAGARWNAPLLWVWNLNIAAASIGLLAGGNRGWEVGELSVWNVAVLLALLLGLTAQMLVTVHRRVERPLYVSLWYLIAALVWTDANLVLLLVGPDHMPGINNAAWHGLFIHYVVGLWITPAGYVLIYYFLPAALRAPIYSHRLSLIGFWSLAFFYPFVGIHHYLYSPIADWAETVAIVSSMMLIIPVWTVLQNFFGTMIGHWQDFGRNLPAKFLVTGAVLYLVGCFQGSVEALRSLQQPTHFTDFVVGHSHLTIFGTFVIWAIGGALYVWPRLAGAPLWSFRLANWSYWLITAGIVAMALVLIAQGLQQGFMLMAGAEFLDTVNTMRPYWWIRTLTGISMDIGTSLLVITLMRTSAPAPVPAPRPDLASAPPAPPPAWASHFTPGIATYALGAGLAFVALAMLVQGLLPSLAPETRTPTVTRAVRTDLGDVKWVRYDAAPYEARERRGRRVYIREGCWYCHSQYVRPVAGEEFRWGPISEAGEYAFDQPHLLSTRRIGPDLTRVGLKYSDDWHYAHLWNPRVTVPESNMPAFGWLFETTEAVYRTTPTGAQLERAPALERWFTFRADRPITLLVDAEGRAFVRPPPDGAFPVDGTPVLDFQALSGRPFAGHDPARASSHVAVHLMAPAPDAVALVRYLQRLGTDRGVWRDVFEPQAMSVSVMSVPDSEAMRELGRDVFGAHCSGCHGTKGDGSGPAARFLSPRPRDLTAGVFKFRTTPAGALPTDGDLFRTITRGVRWTAMPPWHEVAEQERLAVIAYLKTLSPRWRDDTPETPLTISPPPPATADILTRGKALYATAKCAECHGETGRGDGPSASQLNDDFNVPIRPADFSRGEFKGGAAVSDIYRTMTAGLDGTPMPSFADAMTDDERWAISYYVLSLSAWSDPRTGERLPLLPQARAALMGPGATAPRTAYDPATAAAVTERAPRRGR